MVDAYRVEKLSKLKSLGVNPYPYSFDQRNHSIEITSNFKDFEGKDVSVAGRIVRLRVVGKLTFIDLLDQDGKIQVLAAEKLTIQNTEKDSLKLLDFIDSGDIIGVKGKVMKTKRGEVSIEARSIELLSKSLSGLPEKFHGLTDIELRYRKRHLDLISNPNVRSFFITRAKILKYVRDFLDSKGYVEFETPVLQPTYGGANAKPFKTYVNALKSDFFLRIADELYLKRLIIGGFEKVYEVSKDFRNEDIDSTHNPEFTQVEMYAAFQDYEDYMKMLEEMISGMVKSIFRDTKITYQGKELNFKTPFKRVYWVEVLKKKTGIDVSTLTNNDAQKIAKKEGLKTSIPNAYHVADALFDKYIKPELFEPVFVVDYPAYMCPLTKVKRGNPLLSERFEFYIAGKEDGNCYSELTDPLEQRKNFEQQEKERKAGDEEAPPFDSDFIEAIETGMPPTAGLGLAIDRLAMILTNNTSIKEVIPFPIQKPFNDQNSQTQ